MIIIFVFFSLSYKCTLVTSRRHHARACACVGHFVFTSLKDTDKVVVVVVVGRNAEPKCDGDGGR